MPSSCALTPRTPQGVISSLQYNHSPGYHHNVAKGRPFSRIMDTARDTLRAALPIKCLEVRGERTGGRPGGSDRGTWQE